MLDRLTPATGGRAFALRSRLAGGGGRSKTSSSRRRSGKRTTRRNLLLAASFGRGRVPVVYHLRSEHQVQGETGNESVENELVVDLLECGEDARKGAGEVVEDLEG